MKWIKNVTDPDTKVGAAFDRIIYLLILLSLVLFALETLPNAARYEPWFVWSERIIVAIFTIEYALRTIANRRGYVLGFYGIIDLLAILPFYVSLGAVDLRSIRILRLLRLLRMAKLHRYGSAWRRLRLALVSVKRELAIYCGLTLALIYISSVGIYYFEHDAQPEAFGSVFHSMWWAVATLTTVGYGDVYPVTIGGRLFTFVILILGLGVISVPSGLLASALMRQAPEAETPSSPSAAEVESA